MTSRHMRQLGDITDDQGNVLWVTDPTADYSGSYIPPASTVVPTATMPSASGTDWGQVLQTVVTGGVQAYQAYTKQQAVNAGIGIQYSAQYPQGYTIQNGAIVPLAGTTGAVGSLLSGTMFGLPTIAVIGVAAFFFLK